MGLLKPLQDSPGYLKAGCFGFSGAGKTYTQALLAIAAYRQFNLTGPIAFFDTEGGSPYIKELFAMLTGHEPVGVRSRSFGQLLEVAKEVEKDGVSVLIVDSITHVWRELLESYQKANHRKFLQFQDWGPIKKKFAQWTEWLLNSKVHVLVAGRAGWEYDLQEGQGGKKEIVKTNTKMKAESEFGFEPSLVFEMERLQDEAGGVVRIKRRCVVLKDRFSIIDGLAGTFRSHTSKGGKTESDYEKELKQVEKFFAPHLARLAPGSHAPVDLEAETDLSDTKDDWPQEKRKREILAEEIKGELVAKHPGTSEKAKQAKSDLIHKVFNTRSWKKVESMPSDALRDGLKNIRALLGIEPVMDGEGVSTQDVMDMFDAKKES